MPTFNSLGSNYDLKLGLKAFSLLFSRVDNRVLKKLDAKIREVVPGNQSFLVYKGRDAIEAALRLENIGTGDVVLTQALSCDAIEEAIARTEARAGYVDIGEKTFNPTVEILTKALKQYPAARAVIIQHTLGIPAEIKAIRAWCDKNKLVLIEDLASALGGADRDRVVLGTYGDYVILSFGRDKILDAVSGGALIVKKKLTAERVTELESSLKPVSRQIVTRDLLYPILTWKIRTYHAVLIGQVIFKVAKTLGLLTSPVTSPTKEMTSLPPALAQLALWQLESLPAAIQHRQNIAQIYQHKLNSPLYVESSSFVRFSFLTNDPNSVISKLKAHGIYASDRWYRSAVDCGSQACQTEYVLGSCPVAERVAEQVMNLPTHRYITEEKARNILNYV